MILTAAMVLQSDPELAAQLQRLVNTQIVVAISLGLIALAALGVAVGAILAIRKLTAAVGRITTELTPRVSPLLSSATNVAAGAEDLVSSVKTRVDEVLQTIDDVNQSLKTGAQAVEDRVKQFGTVVDVVQSEAENLLLDAASTAHGVHAAARMLRSEGPARTRSAKDDEDDDYKPDQDAFAD